MFPSPKERALKRTLQILPCIFQTVINFYRELSLQNPSFRRLRDTDKSWLDSFLPNQRTKSREKPTNLGRFLPNI
jgi:hypothetical protein